VRFAKEEIYVIVDYGYHGQPDSNGYAYASKEEAQAVVDKVS